MTSNKATNRILAALVFIGLYTSSIFNTLLAQTLWIEAGVKNYRGCNQHMMYQTADTLYWFNTGFEAASNQVLYKNDYFLRGDSIFQKPLSREVLYTLSNDPDSLPDSLKGPFLLGVFQADSLVLTDRRNRYTRYLKKASSSTLSKTGKQRLTNLMRDFVFEVDINTLQGKRGADVKPIEYRDLTNVKVKPTDPQYSPDGIYFISDVCFLHIPAARQKFFQVIDVDKRSILLESLCGKRKQVRLEKTIRKK